MCDTLVVVTDGGVLFGKNSDRAANEAQVLDWQPAREYPAGATVRCTWLTIPQARRTHAVLLSRPYWLWGAEMAANEHGVMIGNEAVFTRQQVPRIGLTGMDLLRLAVERAESAEAAVTVLHDLIAAHGQGGACDHESARFAYFSSFIVADRTRAYVVETAGRELAVERVTGARAISNGLTLPDFAARHSDRVKTWASECRVRRARTEAGVREASDLGAVLRTLRDHGHDEAPSLVRYRWLNGAMKGPCMHAGGRLAAAQTVASWAALLSPDPGGDRHLVTATAAPCTGLFKPVTVTEPVTPALLGPLPSDRADPASLFWRHERLHRRVMRDPGRLLPLFAAERDALEARWLADPPSPDVAFAEGNRQLERWSGQVESALREQPAPTSPRPGFVEGYWRERDRRAGLHGHSPQSRRAPWGTW